MSREQDAAKAGGAIGPMPAPWGLVSLSLAVLLSFCLAITLVEAVSGYGSDNLSIPLFAVIVLGDPAALAGPMGLLAVAAALVAALAIRNRLYIRSEDAPPNPT